jgi:hypothetical protein
MGQTDPVRITPHCNNCSLISAGLAIAKSWIPDATCGNRAASDISWWPLNEWIDENRENLANKWKDLLLASRKGAKSSKRAGSPWSEQTHTVRKRGLWARVIASSFLSTPAMGECLRLKIVVNSLYGWASSSQTLCKLRLWVSVFDSNLHAVEILKVQRRIRL